MISSLLMQLWNASPKTITQRIFRRFFSKRKPFDPHLYELLSRDEILRLKEMPRYASTSAQFMGRKLELVDADSFLSMIDEIFVKKNYEFEARRKDPVIIDCGANIGLSIIFFKKLYPDCSIIAFEADKAVFSALQNNIASFGFRNVALHNKAVWNSETELDFYAEGSWGGRLTKPGDVNNIVKVATARLKDFLEQKVDFLKIDVEGAETQILQDCADQLAGVRNLFVEYHSHSRERQTLQVILSILQAAGFRYHIKEALTRDRPFINRTAPGMDLQLDIFAFRLGD